MECAEVAGGWVTSGHLYHASLLPGGNARLKVPEDISRANVSVRRIAMTAASWTDHVFSILLWC